MTAALQKNILISSLFLLIVRLAAAQGLIIPSASYVTANTGNIVLQNNWVNNGTFTHNGGTDIFNGTTQTPLGGPATTFNNLPATSTSTTTITTPGQMVRGIVLSNKTLNA